MLDADTFRAQKFATQIMPDEVITVNPKHWAAMSAEQRAEIRQIAKRVNSTIENEEPAEVTT